MPYLTVVRMQGDPDELLRVKRERFDPVALRVGSQNGLILHVCARTDEGLLALNLWESREGSEATSADPALQGANDASGADAVPLAYEHYDVEQFELIRSSHAVARLTGEGPSK